MSENKIRIIVLVLCLGFAAFMFGYVWPRARDNDEKKRHALYESYVRVYKIEMSYEDWKILYRNDKLPHFVGSN